MGANGTTDCLSYQADVRSSLAEVLHMAGHTDEASEAARGSLALYRRKGHRVGVREATILLGRLQASLEARSPLEER